MKKNLPNKQSKKKKKTKISSKNIALKKGTIKFKGL
jgi:hypothetical protein